MDNLHVDALARFLGQSRPRRTLSGLLGALGAAVFLSSQGGLPGAEAKKRRASMKAKRRRKKKRVEGEGPCGNGKGPANRCRKHSDCCTRRCNKRIGRCRCQKANKPCNRDQECCPGRTGRTCQAGTCQPVRPQPRRKCADTQTDPNNCGACGNVCRAHEACVGGKCVCAGTVCASGCPYPTIQAAIDDPNGPAIIRLCAQTYAETITITRDVTLIGVGQGPDGTVLDGQQIFTVVTIAPEVEVAMQALRITGGNSPQFGSHFGNGGGIYNEGQLTMTDCTVTGNDAHFNGGGIHSGFDGDPRAEVNLIRCTLSSNRALNGYGGGLENQLSGRVNLTNCKVTENEANQTGGGIQMANGAATIDSCTITLNEAGQAGGGIYINTAVMTYLGTNVIKDNEPNDCWDNSGSGQCPT